MKMQFLFGVVILLLCLGTGVASAGNSDRIGTAGAQELTIPNSARGMALGEGAVADAGGVEMLYYNPAAIAGVRTVEAYFTHLSYIADMTKDYVAIAATSNIGTIAVSVDVFQIGDIIETTEESPDGTGRVFSPNFSVLGLSYGRYMTEDVRIGTTLKIINESILQTTATGVAFDAGILYRPGPKGISFGLAVKNFGPDMHYSGSEFESFHQTSDNPNSTDRALASQSAAFELPSYFELGARYELEAGSNGRFAGYGSFQSNNFNNDEFHLGGEYVWDETIALRGGGVLSGNNDYLFGPAFGVGIALPIGGDRKLDVDYTLRTVTDFFDDNQMFGIRFEF